MTRADRRKFRTLALGVGTAATLLAITVVVVVSAVGSRAGTLVSSTGCSNTRASNLRFDPITGAEGTSVYITGSNFADVTDITFNGKSVNSFSIVSATEITTAVPGGASSGPIAIVSNATPITSDTCFTTTSPAVTSFSPTSGAAGTVLTITGTNFTGATAVRFNGSPATPTSVSATSITVTVPANAVTGLVSVETPVSTGVATRTFSVSSAAITEFSPALGAAGTVVTITGANLSGAMAVRFGTTPAATFTNVSATTVRATVPANVTSGPISIKTAAGTATASAGFAAPPSITSFSPATAAPGSTVTLTGTNLSSVTSVGFTGTTAEPTFTIDSPTQITTTVPTDATTGQLSVRGTAFAISATPLTISPSISSIWPTNGLAGTVVTITGFNLSKLNAVIFNGIPAQFQTVSYTQVTATVPTGSTAGAVRVLSAAGDANSPVAFGPQTVPALPTDSGGPISVPTPSSGSGSTTTTTPTTSAPTATTTPATTTPSTTSAPATTATATEPTTTTPTTAAPASTAPSTTSAATTTTAPTAAAAPTTLSAARIALSNQVGTSTTDTSGVLTWNGTADATFGKLRIPVSLRYTSETNWTLTANNATASFAIRSVTLSIGSITGTVTATPSSTVWDLRGKLASAASIIGDSGATANGRLALLAGGTVRIQPSCPRVAETTSVCPANDTASMFLALQADGTGTGSGFYANLGSGIPAQPSGAYSAAANLATGAFVMLGTFDATSTANLVSETIVMSSLTLKVAANDPTFAALPGDITIDSGSANGGFDVLVSGRGRVSVPMIGSFAITKLSIAYADGGTVTVGTLSNKADLGGARMGSIAYFGAQQDTAAKVLGTMVRVPARTFMFAGSLPTPRWIHENLGVPKDNFGAYATYTTNGLLKITAVIPASLKLPPIPRVKTTISAFTLTAIVDFEPNVGSEFGFQIAANGSMTINDNNPVEFVLAAKYLSTCTSAGPAIGPQQVGVPAPTVCYTEKSPEFTASISAAGANGGAVWPNVFGITGLSLNTVAIQIGLTPSVFPYVSIGLAGDGTIPGKLREYMGIDSNANIPVSFVMNLSSVRPCLSVTVGDPNSSTPIAAFPPKSQAVTVTLLSLLVSPLGCSVGIFDVPAGLQIRAKTKVMATTVDLFGAYDPNPGGPPGLPKTPQLRAWLTVDNPTSDQSFRIDGQLRFFAAAGGWNPAPRVEIAGGIKVGGAARINVFGSCTVLIGCSATGSGNVSLNGFGLEMTVTVKNLLTSLMAFEASGSLRVAGAQVTVSGSAQPATNSYSFSGSGTFPSGSPLRSFDVELASLFNPPKVENGSPVYVPPTFRARFRAAGSLGGRFTAVSGSSSEFTTGWVNLIPNLSDLTLVISPNLDLGLVSVPVTLGFVVCLTGSCAGRVTPRFNFTSTFKGLPFHIPDTDLGNDWGFNASTSAYFSGSDQVGNRNAGLRGSFSGDVTLGISSSAGLTVGSNVKVTVYVGAGGWDKIGSRGTDMDISGANFRFCYSRRVAGKNFKICIP